MNDDNESRLRAIIDALVAGTRDGRIEWAWNGTQGSGTATLANGRVFVTKDQDSDTVITIFDTDSNPLESINLGFREHRNLKRQGDQLYELARRSALKVDSKLESILREISP